MLGDFTGKALCDYFNDFANDPVGARMIVNGTDKAQLIAGYHTEFLEAVVAAARASAEPRLALGEPEEPTAPAKLPALQQDVRQASAEEARATGDEDVHGLFEEAMAWYRRSQSRPSLVPLRGRYSQPTKPL